MPKAIEWTWSEIRDRTQIGGFFGLLGGVIALLVALLHRFVATWAGRTVPRALATHASLILLYLAIGMLIGTLWPRRADRLGRWTLWLLAAVPLAVTIMAIARGAPAGWSARSWWQLAIVIPALTWVMGDGSKVPRISKEFK